MQLVTKLPPRKTEI